MSEWSVEVSQITERGRVGYSPVSSPLNEAVLLLMGMCGVEGYFVDGSQHLVRG